MVRVYSYTCSNTSNLELGNLDGDPDQVMLGDEECRRPVLR